MFSYTLKEKKLKLIISTYITKITINLIMNQMMI